MNIKTFHFIFETFLLLTFFLLCFYKLNLPGLYYDEALFINAAITDRLNNNFIYLSVFEIPIMLMQYLGALKSWLYYFVFNIFNINIYSIRLPMIFLAILTMHLNYKFAKQFFSAKVALIFLILCVFDLTSIMTTRIDWGPTTLMMLFRILFLYSFFLFMKTKESKYFYQIIIYSILGIFDKANFIWFVLAGVISYFALEFHKLKSFSSKFNKYYLLSIFFITLVIIALVFVLKIDIISNLSLNHFGDRFRQVFFGFISNLYGSNISDVLITTSVDLKFRKLIILFLIFVFCITFTIQIFSNKIINKNIKFLLIFSFVLFIEILITKKAGGPHHYAVFSPIIYLPISYYLVYFIDNFLHIRNSFKNIIYSLFLFFYVYSSIIFYHNIIDGFKNNISPLWTSDISVLVNQLEQNNIENVYCIDWGLCNQIQALSNFRIIVYDFWPSFNSYAVLNDEEKHYLKNSVNKNENVAFVMFKDSNKIFGEPFKGTIPGYNLFVADFQIKTKLLIEDIHKTPYLTFIKVQ